MIVPMVLGVMVAALSVALIRSQGRLKQLDLNQRRQSLQKISADQNQASREMNRTLAIFECMAEGVLVIDAAQKVVLINKALGRILGQLPEQAKNRYFWEIFRDSELNAMLVSAFEKQLGLRREHAIALSDCIFDIQISPVRAGKDFLGLVAVFHDLTKLKELEKTRTEFVANVSHELKTPLTSILGFVETLKEGAVEDRQNRMKFLNIIEEHARKLNHLVEDLLLLAKVESGQRPFHPEPIRLLESVRRTVSYFEKALRAKKIELSANIPEGLSVTTDRGALEQILSNLIDNAIKYNRDGGKVAVQASAAEGFIHIEVSDTGIGISSSDLDRIFERFYRADKSRSRELGGTGLGLAIAKHLTERLGGSLTVRSIPDKGTSFVIAIPRRES